MKARNWRFQAMAEAVRVSWSLKIEARPSPIHAKLPNGIQRVAQCNSVNNKLVSKSMVAPVQERTPQRYVFCWLQGRLCIIQSYSIYKLRLAWARVFRWKSDDVNRGNLRDILKPQNNVYNPSQPTSRKPRLTEDTWIVACPHSSGW